MDHGDQATEHGHDHGHDHGDGHDHDRGGAVRQERRCDVAVVGGSAAGLAAALQLGRQRRAVIVIDDGEPRNAPAAHMHSFLGREGQPPAALLADGRAEVRSYGGEVLAGRVETVTGDVADGFRLAVDGGRTVVARRVLLATGIVDVLPAIPGVAEHWGKDVIHCPFCHGYDVRDRRIVAIVTHPMGLHALAMFRQLTDRLTVVIHQPIPGDADATVDRLRSSGVTVLDGPVARLVDGDHGRLAAVELADGTYVDADAAVVGPAFRPRADAVEVLGVRLVQHPSGLGSVVEADATGATSVPGVFAAGNVTDPSQQVLPAAAAGSWAGGMIANQLAQEDLDGARRSALADDWDHRYGGDRIWSGNPNGALVREAADLTPGTALDVGAGEGGDAVWLAEQGWTVTAADVSARGLDHIAAAAADRGLAVTGRLADANDPDPFGGATFDLVTAHYASIPRTPDDRAIANLVGAVAPGGTLLVVGHDPIPMRAAAAGGPGGHRPMFDPDAYVQADDVAAAIADDPAWSIEVHGPIGRPPGAASASHHADDIVLRARRRA